MTFKKGDIIEVVSGRGWANGDWTGSILIVEGVKKQEHRLYFSPMVLTVDWAGNVLRLPEPGIKKIGRVET